MNKAFYVDPIIGTVGDEQGESLHGGGKTHPGACLPGGMVQLAPDTVTGGDNGTGYNYCHTTIEGFSFNHMSGIGWYGDLGNLQVMPVTGETDLRSGSNREVPFICGSSGWKSSFSHEKEVATAGYYSAFLERYGITAEATVTPHTGILQFTYPAEENAKLILNFSRRIAGHSDFQKIHIVNNQRIEGLIHCTPEGGGFGRGKGGIGYDLYFVCELSAKAESMQFFENEAFVNGFYKTYEGEDVGLLIDFGRQGKPIVMQCGISYTDLIGARENLKSEWQDFDFDSAHKQAEACWEKALSAFEVDGSNEIDKTLFYTCLYHTLLDPRSAEDVDGRFAIDGVPYGADDYTQRTMFSGWDVYRSEFPLLTLLRPDVVNDEICSLLKIAELKNTSFPRWELMGHDSKCMCGDPGVLIMADAYLKGIRNFNIDQAYELALASCKSQDEYKGKPFRSLHPKSEAYINQAYDIGSLSDTLEFLLVDFVMLQLARKLGREEDVTYFTKRVMTYQDNFNPKTGFMGPRDENGSFKPVKDEYDTIGCLESNIYQQSWFVPYDVKGLSRLFGEKRCIDLLERLFEQADFSALWNENYNHSNEPCHNLTHYFNLLGLAHRTQYWTRRVQKEAYRLGAFGFCGNEDVGQISAWYVLSAMGFAQVCPGYDAYFVNTPLFRKTVLHLNQQYHSREVSDTFCILCSEDPLASPYIRSMSLNGKALRRPYVTYSEITAGGTLYYELSKEPCEDFGKNVSGSFV